MSGLAMLKEAAACGVRLSMAAEFGWTSGELFDVPRGDGTSGLIWFLKGEPVRSLGPDHAVLGNGTHVFDRIERGEWIDRHAKGK